MEYPDRDTLENEKIGRISDWLKNKSAAPFRVHYNPTNACNLDCRFCGQKHERRSAKELSADRALELVREAEEMGVREWFISGGGEPFCRPDLLLSVMKEIKRKGMVGEIITNGTRIDKKTAEMLVELKWDRITFSVEAPDAETDDFLRGKAGAFAKTIGIIEILKGMKKKRDSCLPRLAITTVLCNRNFKSLPEMVELCARLDLDFFSINPIKSNPEGEGRAHHELRLEKKDLDELNAYIGKANELAKELNVKTNFDEFVDVDFVAKSDTAERFLEPVESASGMPCFQPWYNIFIDPEGRVGPCCELSRESISLKQKSLKTIWYDQIEPIRARLMKGDLFGECSSCGMWQIMETQRIRKLLAATTEINDISDEFELLNLANFCKDNGKYRQAIKAYTKIKKLSPVLLNKIGRCHKELGEYDEAITFFKEAVERNPAMSVVWRNLGECFMEKEMYDQAVEYLNQSVKINDNQAWSWFSLGKCYTKKKQYREAIECLKRNLEVERQDAASYHHSRRYLEICYHELGEDAR